MYIALKNGKIIGDVTAWRYGNYIEIDDFSVIEKERGKGIGSQLQKRASQNDSDLILISEEENRQMYEHQGYQEVAYYWAALQVEKG
ncbi:hypothetical protein HMPREF9318_00570 [Streptococcus urinalis FB127-CNA-2]|uniref:Acetyltransferase, GNAT family n=1 Tax=Streptococcus urinalis 2285-97 TaxID=764291 RepID=G5KGK4_9STRE|nr:acetyltransferase, GNAT family [Streptococcus urinalis 2285-97]EKS22372.1 hypothetical protein HMPREF9318_00570 [Streptococcus urinalis FB127-CNA-2]VEF32185.1 acetyltransferase (GNAT) family protein [Streptococcus urinalis]